MDNRKTITQLATQAVVDRRWFHQYPELAWSEFETAKYIQNRLEKLGIEQLDYKTPNVIGFLKGTNGDKTIALRADIDALPLTEEGDKPYISKKPGVTHACGHDGHTAILLAVAEWIVENREQVEPNILFIFQTSEENIPSGAQYLVKQGVLDNVDAIFGTHLWQGLEKGKIGLADGPMMASTDDFEITISGKGGHGSMPQETVDPIYIASHVIQGLQSIVSRKMDPTDLKVISIGHVEAGKTFNVIPGTATLRGTVRAFTLDNVDFMQSKITQITEGVCKAFDAVGTVKHLLGTPPLINDTSLSIFVEQVIKDSFGDDVFETIKPFMGGEDFSYYLLKKPGVFTFVGMGGEKSAYPHHHPRFDIDEDVFPSAIELFINIVKNFR